MNTVFQFASVQSPYVADAVILCCFDHRISRVAAEFLRGESIELVDWIMVAGGAKALASPGNQAERDFILEQIRTSICLHHSKRVLLTTHGDCGAYGGLVRFSGDHSAEREFHESELKRATDVVTEHFPGVTLTPYFIDFDGVWRPE